MRGLTNTTERAVFFAFPLLVLLVSYAALCVDTQTLWPWYEIVHESGDKTLLDTLLYYDHAARELPLDLVLGAAVAAAMIANGRNAITRSGTPMLVGWVLVTLVIVVGAAQKVGIDGVGKNLVQLYTRPGAEPQWGAHWRYHFLSRLGLIVMAWWVVGGHRWLTKEPAVDRTPRYFTVTVVAFFVLSLVFLPTLEPFYEPRFLGHQAREAVTHAIVTVPLAVGLCLHQTRRAMPSVRGTAGGIVVAMILSALPVLYVGLGAVLTDAQSDAQSSSPVRLVATHFFEHGFTYLVTPFFAAWLHRRWSKS